MAQKRTRRLLLITAGTAAALGIATIAGCVRTSGGTWYFKVLQVR